MVCIGILVYWYIGVFIHQYTNTPAPLVHRPANTLSVARPAPARACLSYQAPDVAAPLALVLQPSTDTRPNLLPTYPFLVFGRQSVFPIVVGPHPWLPAHDR